MDFLAALEWRYAAKRMNAKLIPERILSNHFSLRGKKKVQGQWQLYCLVQNIEKLASYGRLAA